MERIEIFRTNVRKRRDAKKIMQHLKMNEPGYSVNFDLEDRDHILRIASRSKEVNTRAVVEILNNNNFYCEVLN